jgi:hypothetical protein
VSSSRSAQVICMPNDVAASRVNSQSSQMFLLSAYLLALQPIPLLLAPHNLKPAYHIIFFFLCFFRVMAWWCDGSAAKAVAPSTSILQIAWPPTEQCYYRKNKVLQSALKQINQALQALKEQKVQKAQNATSAPHRTSAAFTSAPCSRSSLTIASQP